MVISSILSLERLECEAEFEATKSNSTKSNSTKQVVFHVGIVLKFHNVSDSDLPILARMSAFLYVTSPY
jgi:hypothetical protein